MLKFKYGSLDKFKNLETKDPDVLYFLDNHTIYKGDNLLSVVKTVEGDFPEIPTNDMRETYFISLATGRIKYVTNDLQYIDITKLQLDTIVFDEDFINRIVEQLGKYTETVTMPVATVEGKTLCLTNSNKQQIQIIKF